MYAFLRNYYKDDSKFVANDFNYANYVYGICKVKLNYPHTDIACI